MYEQFLQNLTPTIQHHGKSRRFHHIPQKEPSQSNMTQLNRHHWLVRTTPNQFLICSSFRRQKGHPLLLICSSCMNVNNPQPNPLKATFEKMYFFYSLLTSKYLPTPKFPWKNHRSNDCRGPIALPRVSIPSGSKRQCSKVDFSKDTSQQFGGKKIGDEVGVLAGMSCWVWDVTGFLFFTPIDISI